MKKTDLTYKEIDFNIEYDIDADDYGNIDVEILSIKLDKHDVELIDLLWNDIEEITELLIFELKPYYEL